MVLNVTITLSAQQLGSIIFQWFSEFCPTSWPARYFKQLLPFSQVSTVPLDTKDEMDNVKDVVEILG